MKTFPGSYKVNKFFFFANAVVISLLLNSCGGGGGSTITYSISGQVTSGGTGLSGVTIALGAGSAAVTDTNGNYTVTGLANGTYTITPDKTGFAFSPASCQQTLNSANITAVDFTTALQVVACPASGTADVVIQDDYSFNPSMITVAANEIVKWTNNASVVHTVTSGASQTKDNKFDSGSLTTGGSFCVQLLTPGTYPYFCTPHSFMTGAVTVQ